MTALIVLGHIQPSTYTNVHQRDNPLVSAPMRQSPGEAMHTARWCVKAQLKL